MKNFDERLTRIETRLVQLMVYLQCNVAGRNKPGEFFDNMKGALDGITTEYQTDRGNSGGPAPSPDWAALDRPAYIRRSRDHTECTDHAPEECASEPAV